MHITAFITTALLLIILGIYFWLVQKKLKEAAGLLAGIKEKYAPALELEESLTSVESNYNNLKEKYNKNISQLRENENILALYEVGVGTMDSVAYSLEYAGQTLHTIEAQLVKIKEAVKDLVRQKDACVCALPENTVVNDSKAQARKFINREIKLRIRCLDNEVKMAIALSDWNNINRLIKRVEQAFSDINKSGALMKVTITPEYLKVKLSELKLTFEITQLKQDIKEEDREEKRIQREAEREEVKIKAAAEKAVRDRERMEALVKSEVERLGEANQQQREVLEMHKKELEILKAREIRAISMAQLTRSGFVYIISNLLSFGPGICKIGMTRRVDPNDRVRELGDASVPDLFTAHAFIYSEDAPRLENYLHKKYEDARVNMVNKRKEFFRVNYEDVLDKLEGYDGKCELEVLQ